MSGPAGDRRTRLLAGLDLAHDRGFEVGPLHSPMVPKEGADVVYLDHASTEDLRRKYADHPNVGEIAPVDAVWGSAQLSDALADELARRGPFRYGVASHVIEHVPDVIGWLDQIAGVLVPGGTLHLAIPDKRYCFDFHRTSSDVAELVAAHLEGRSRPPAAAVFDFWAKHTVVDAQQLWRGEGPPIGPGQDDFALIRSQESYGADGYFDVHCWVFTPETFLDALDRLGRLGLLPFSVKELQPTGPGDAEFLVVLERLSDDLAPEERTGRQRAAVDRARHRLPLPEPDRLWLSARERGLIEAKRRVAGALRVPVARAKALLRPLVRRGR